METPTVTVTATELKATCLSMLDRLASRELERVEVTKRGKVVAVITPPELPKSGVSWFGCMRDQTIIPEGADLTEPAFDGIMDAELGVLHR